MPHQQHGRQHSIVFDNKDDFVLWSIAQELHITLNQPPLADQSASDPSRSSGPDGQGCEFRLESFLTRPRVNTTLFPPRVQKTRYERILCQERLVLLSVGLSSPTVGRGADTDKDANTDKEDSKSNHVLIAGLEVLEYTLTPLSPSGSNKTSSREERIIYIAKVDTSGYWPIPGFDTSSPRGKSPAQALVKGYLRSVRATSHGLDSLPSMDDSNTFTTIDNSSNSSAAAAAKMSSLSIANPSTKLTTKRPNRPGKTSLFIFARAQPQYLFADSAKNPRKRVLDDRGLVRWWKNTAASVYAEDLDPPQEKEQEKEEKEKDCQTEQSRSRSGKTRVQGWWHIPGMETDRQAHNVIQSSTSTTSTFQWTYGYPDKDSPELANALIPQFPDDPKSRMMQSPSCQGGFVNVQTFWELAAIGEESGAGRITGFFRVVEEAVDGDDAGEQSTREGGGEVEADSENVKKKGQEEKEYKSVTGTTAGYTKVINFLLDLDFSTLEAAQRSTVAWQERVEVWVRKSSEREVEHALEVRKARQVEEGKEEEEVEVEVKEGVDVARPLWIQKGTVRIFLRHGLQAPVIQEPAAATTTTAAAATVTPAVAPAAAQVVVNTLSMGLIKRKTPSTSTSATSAASAAAPTTPAVNVLGAGLIKRKVVAPAATTITSTPSTPSSETPVPAVNVLGANLIKRKVAPTSITPTFTSDASSATAASASVVNVLGASFIKKRKTDS
ncbi:hypothetical protein BGW39_011694 [Mortierella sp. 14UC]|nr:hypothetical protein BGW39_011694 [Mortierella sp. 14UC]